MTPEDYKRADERNHCECLAHDFLEDLQVQELSRSAQQSQLAELIEDERAAARQEGYNAHLEQLARHAQPTEDEREHCERVAESFDTDAFCTWQDRAKVLLRERAAVRAEAAQAAASLRDAYEALTAANAELERLQARVRELEQGR